MAQHQRPERSGTYSAIGLLQLHLLNSSLSVRNSALVCTGPLKSDPSSVYSSWHLLQQLGDEEASQPAGMTAGMHSFASRCNGPAAAAVSAASACNGHFAL